MANEQLQNAMAPQAQAAPGQDPGFAQRYDSWMAHLKAPETRAALLQAGIAMLQPRAPGQTFMGHVGQAIGEGGQAAARVSETQRLTRKDAREQARLDQQTNMQNENLALSKEELAIAKRTADRADATAAGAAAQQVKDNEFKEKELALKTASQKALEGYYSAMAGRAASSKDSLPAGYQEALDVAKTEAGLADDPLTAFFAAKAAIDARFGLTTGGGGGSAATASGPVPPKPGEVRDGWKFKGGDPSQQSSWEKVK